MNDTYDLSFRCYYDNRNCNDHRQLLHLNDIPRWIQAYKFTHPNCISITVKIWFCKNQEQTTLDEGRASVL